MEGAEERIHELNSRTIEITQSEQKEKIAAGTCGTVLRICHWCHWGSIRTVVRGKAEKVLEGITAEILSLDKR